MIKKKKRTKNLVFISLLLCYILISLSEPFGIVKAYAGINRSITSDSDRVAIVDNNGNLKFSVKAVGALEEMEKKVQQPKIVCFLTNFQRGVLNQIEQLEIQLLLLSIFPKTSLTACVTKPV